MSKKRKKPKLKPGDLVKDTDVIDEADRKLVDLLAIDGKLAETLNTSSRAWDFFKSRASSLMDFAPEPNSRASEPTAPADHSDKTDTPRISSEDKTDTPRITESDTGVSSKVIHRINKTDTPRINSGGESDTPVSTKVIQCISLSDTPRISSEVENEIGAKNHLRAQLLRETTAANTYLRQSTLSKLTDLLFESVQQGKIIPLSVRRFSAQTGVSINTARKIMNFLVQHNYIIPEGQGFYRVGSKLQEWARMYSIVSSGNNITTTTNEKNISHMSVEFNPYAIGAFYADYRFRRAKVSMAIHRLSADDVLEFANFMMLYGLASFFIFVDYVVERSEEIRQLIPFVRKVLPTFKLPADKSTDEIDNLIRAARSALKFDPEHPDVEDVRNMGFLNSTMRLYAAHFINGTDPNSFISAYKNQVRPSVEAASAFVDRIYVATRTVANSKEAGYEVLDI